MTVTDQEKFVEGIREAFKGIIADQEEASKTAKVEDLVASATSTINELTETITTKDKELSASSSENELLMAQIEELKAKTQELEQKLADAENMGEEYKVRATAAEGELSSIAIAARLQARMDELDEAKVSKSGEKREVQATRVRGLSDEEFSAYKEELVEVRSEVIAQLEVEKAAVETPTIEDEAEVDVAPAAITDASREEASAVAAILNVEIVSKDLQTTYLEMAAAMAKSLARGRE